MAKISNLHEVLASEDVGTAGGGDKDVATVDAVLHRGHLGQEQWLLCRRPFLCLLKPSLGLNLCCFLSHLIALHGSLQGVDGVDLSDDHLPEKG